MARNRLDSAEKKRRRRQRDKENQEKKRAAKAKRARSSLAEEERKEQRRRTYLCYNEKRRSSQESFAPSSQDSSQHPATNASISRQQNHQRIYITDALIILKLSQVSRLPLTAVMAIYRTEVSPVLLNQCEASNPKEVALSKHTVHPCRVRNRSCHSRRRSNVYGFCSFSVKVSAYTDEVFGSFLRPADMSISIQTSEERLMTQCSRMVRHGP